MNGKTDARIVKTMEKLKGSLLTLMKDHSIDSISVTCLCKAAGINRNTFYAHYREPVDLLMEIENGLLGEMMQTLGKLESVEVGNIYSFVIPILETITKNSDICQIILSDHGNRHFINKIVEMLKGPTTRAWVEKGLTEQEADVSYHYCVGGALSVIENWVKSGYETDAHTLGNMLGDLIESGQIRNIKRY